MHHQNAAEQILEHLGVYSMMLDTKITYRGATPPRRMRKGEDGQRKAGAYGRGIRNLITRQNKQAIEARRS